MIDLQSIGRAAKAAGRRLGTLSTGRKNEALTAIATEIERQADAILVQNARDIADARARGLSEALLDRLMLDDKRVAALADDARHVATLPDPVGAVIDSRILPNGMQLSRRRIPIGVLGVIYEARPNVTVDVATLALKSGNAAILRGGSETLRSNLALVNAIRAALEKVGLPEAIVQYIDNPDRALVTELLRLDEFVDMIIPRGGAGLHRLCREQSTIPVITGGIGICHAFVDASAEFDEALAIIENAKVQRPSVCNALDTVLVHEQIAADFLPRLAARMAQNGVSLRTDEASTTLLQNNGHGANVRPAGPDDFDQEWLALILGVRLVPDVESAIEHIHAHSTDHSETILTRDWSNAYRFVDALSSSAVFVNASTRFNDGGQFGLGAEVAVSTQMLHARGPLGLEELTTYKWVGIGYGHVRP